MQSMLKSVFRKEDESMVQNGTEGHMNNSGTSEDCGSRTINQNITSM